MELALFGPLPAVSQARPRSKAFMARSEVGIIKTTAPLIRRGCVALDYLFSDAYFFTYSPLLHTLNDGDAPQQVSEQYVLWHNRF